MADETLCVAYAGVNSWPLRHVSCLALSLAWRQAGMKASGDAE